MKPQLQDRDAIAAAGRQARNHAQGNCRAAKRDAGRDQAEYAKCPLFDVCILLYRYVQTPAAQCLHKKSCSIY